MENQPVPSGPQSSSPLSEAQELALCQRAIEGDEKALGELLEKLGPVVRQRIIGKISKTWQSILEADDIMQVTYLEVFLQIERFTARGPGSFVAWVTQIADNNLRDAVKGLERAKRPDPRKRVQASSKPSEDSYVALVELLGVTNTTPSVHAARGEIKSALDQVLSTLPPDYERVSRMLDLLGKSVAEAAAELGRSPGAIHMLRARAHDHLRAALGSGSRFFSTPS